MINPDQAHLPTHGLSVASVLDNNSHARGRVNADRRRKPHPGPGLR
jgi:hypothetical protein